VCPATSASRPGPRGEPRRTAYSDSANAVQRDRARKARSQAPQPQAAYDDFDVDQLAEGLANDSSRLPRHFTVSKLTRWFGEDNEYRTIANSVIRFDPREGKTDRSIRMTLSLAFLAPDIVKAAFEGRLPHGYGLKRLFDLPMAWPDQWRSLGLAAPAPTSAST
jgi:hypothetical protein